jgi:hypothetical protein
MEMLDDDQIEQLMKEMSLENQIVWPVHPVNPIETGRPEEIILKKASNQKAKQTIPARNNKSIR